MKYKCTVYFENESEDYCCECRFKNEEGKSRCILFDIELKHKGGAYGPLKRCPQCLDFVAKTLLDTGGAAR